MVTNRKKSSYVTTLNKRLSSLLVLLPLLLIKAYRYFISPMLGNQCRFYPTCSHYSEEAYKRFGVVKGTWLTVRRLIKCHPWHSGGIDLVPETKENKKCCPQG